MLARKSCVYLAITLAIALVSALAGCGETTTPEKVEPGQPAASESKPSPPETFKIGDSVKMGDLVFTVTGVREAQGGDFLKPKEGCKWVVVDVQIENQGKESEAISSLMMFKLADADGYQYTVTIGPETKGSLDGELASGRKMRGEVAFEVPKQAKGLELVIEPSIVGFGQAVFKLDQKQ